MGLIYYLRICYNFNIYKVRLNFEWFRYYNFKGLVIDFLVYSINGKFCEC